MNNTANTTSGILHGFVLFEPDIVTATLSIRGAGEDLSTSGDLDTFGNLTVRGRNASVTGPFATRPRFPAMLRPVREAGSTSRTESFSSQERAAFDPIT